MHGNAIIRSFILSIQGGPDLYNRKVYKSSGYKDLFTYHLNVLHNW